MIYLGNRHTYDKKTQTLQSKNPALIHELSLGAIRTLVDPHIHYIVPHVPPTSYKTNDWFRGEANHANSFQGRHYTADYVIVHTTKNFKEKILFAVEITNSQIVFDAKDHLDQLAQHHPEMMGAIIVDLKERSKFRSPPTSLGVLMDLKQEAFYKKHMFKSGPIEEGGHPWGDDYDVTINVYNAVDKKLTLIISEVCKMIHENLYILINARNFNPLTSLSPNHLRCMKSTSRSSKYGRVSLPPQVGSNLQPSRHTFGRTSIGTASSFGSPVARSTQHLIGTRTVKGPVLTIRTIHQTQHINLWRSPTPTQVKNLPRLSVPRKSIVLVLVLARWALYSMYTALFNNTRISYSGLDAIIERCWQASICGVAGDQRMVCYYACVMVMDLYVIRKSVVVRCPPISSCYSLEQQVSRREQRSGAYLRSSDEDLHTR